MNTGSADRYECRECLGQGYYKTEPLRHRSFGSSFKAWDVNAKETVVVKKEMVYRAKEEAALAVNSLMKCNSEYIARYRDAFASDQGVWVRVSHN